MTDEVTVSGGQMRFDNAIQSSTVNRDTPANTDEPSFKEKTSGGSLGSSTLILLLIAFVRRPKNSRDTDNKP